VTAKQEMQDLIRYNEWANARLLVALRELPGGLLAAPVASSFGSLRDTLAHVVSVEWIWLRRWRGESPASPPEWLKTAGREELVGKLREIEAERSRWLDELPADELEAPRAYRTLGGQEHRHRVADQIRHVVNHSTYHRGQAATQLRQLGRIPPSTDFIVYRRETE